MIAKLVLISRLVAAVGMHASEFEQARHSTITCFFKYADDKLYKSDVRIDGACCQNLCVAHDETISRNKSSSLADYGETGRSRLVDEVKQNTASSRKPTPHVLNDSQTSTNQ